MRKEFDVKANFTVGVFLIAYFLYTVYLLVFQNWADFIPVLIAGVFIYAFFIGFRPYKYIVDRKTLYIKYRLWKTKEIDLMQCETICDPVERFSEVVRRAHAIEIYTTSRKRYPFFPKDRVGFVDAVVRGNKRIHCTVKDYTDVHRQLERQQRKEKRKAEKRAARAKESGK